MKQAFSNEIHQYLTFRLADEKYAINVKNIKEVLGVPKVTKIPKMPPFMNGVINLRGSAVPVIDLRKKFNLGEVSITPDTGIIVLEIQTSEFAIEEDFLVLGIYSDLVEKVITIDPESIEPAPKIGMAIDNSFIHGMGHVDDEFIIILNIHKILTESELSALDVDSLKVEEANN